MANLNVRLWGSFVKIVEVVFVHIIPDKQTTNKIVMKEK